MWLFHWNNQDQSPFQLGRRALHHCHQVTVQASAKDRLSEKNPRTRAMLSPQIVKPGRFFSKWKINKQQMWAGEACFENTPGSHLNLSKNIRNFNHLSRKMPGRRLPEWGELRSLIGVGGIISTTPPGQKLASVWGSPKLRSIHHSYHSYLPRIFA